MPDMVSRRLVWSMIGKSWNMPDMASDRLVWSMKGKELEYARHGISQARMVYDR